MYKIEGLTQKESNILIDPLVKNGICPFNNHIVIPPGSYRAINSLKEKGWLKLAETNYVDNEKFHGAKFDHNFYSYTYGIAREWNIPQHRVLDALGITIKDLQSRIIQKRKPLSETAQKEKLAQRKRRELKELSKGIKIDLNNVPKKERKNVNKAISNWIPNASQLDRAIRLLSNNKFGYYGRVWRDIEDKKGVLRGRPTSTLAYTRKEERKGLTEIFDIKSCIHNIYRSLHTGRVFDPENDMYTCYLDRIRNEFSSRGKEKFIPETGPLALTRETIKKLGMRVIFEKSEEAAWNHFNFSELRMKGTGEEKLLFNIYFNQMRKELGGYDEKLAQNIFLIESKLEAAVLASFIINKKKLLINAYDAFYMNNSDVTKDSKKEVLESLKIEWSHLLTYPNLLHNGYHS